MARNARFHPLFQNDVLCSADWYESKTVGLGVDFTHRIESAIDELLGDPDRRSNIHYGFRYWPIERFPHLILYEATPAEVLLFGAAASVQGICRVHYFVGLDGIRQSCYSERSSFQKPNALSQQCSTSGFSQQGNRLREHLTENVPFSQKAFACTLEYPCRVLSPEL
jgi:hypothetical protein